MGNKPKYNNKEIKKEFNKIDSDQKILQKKLNKKDFQMKNKIKYDNKKIEKRFNKIDPKHKILEKLENLNFKSHKHLRHEKKLCKLRCKCYRIIYKIINKIITIIKIEHRSKVYKKM